MGRFEDRRILESVCRYLVENDTQGDLIPYDEKADIDMIAIVSKFKNKIVDDDYHIFDEDNDAKRKEVQQIRDEITKVIKPCAVSLQEAFDIEDVDSKGYLTLYRFKKVLKDMEIKLKKIHVEYLIYEMYRKSVNSKKLKYNVIFDVLGLKEQVDMFSSNKKVEEVKSDNYDNDFFSEVNDEKTSVVKSNENPDLQKHTTDNAVNETDVEISDTRVVVPDGDKPKNDNDEAKQDDQDKNLFETDENQQQETQNIESENQQENPTNQTGGDHPEGEDDDYIDDEEMIRIAESCLIRISEELKNQNMDIKQLFEENIMVENIGDQPIELLAPIHFIEGLKKLGLDDFTELEIACLVNLLTRPELDDLILVEELNILRDHNKIRESVSEFLDKSPGSGSKEEFDQDNNQDVNDSADKNKRRGLNFAKIGDRSVCVIFLLTEYLLRNNMSLFTLYDGKIYDQLVKTKTKESVVEIISADDFFNIITSGIVSQDYMDTVDDTKELTEPNDKHCTVREDLQNLLCLDQNYKDLLLIKKVTKFIDELTMREDLREQALKVLPDDIEFGDMDDPNAAYNDGGPEQPQPYYGIKNNGLKDPMANKGRNMTKNPYPVAGGERLNTIEEEEKQFDTTSNMYKTNERMKENSSSGLANYRNNTLSKGIGSMEAGKLSSDSRKRLDDDSDIELSDHPSKVKSDQVSIDEELEDNYPEDDHDQIPTEISK